LVAAKSSDLVPVAGDSLEVFLEGRQGVTLLLQVVSLEPPACLANEVDGVSGSSNGLRQGPVKIGVDQLEELLGPSICLLRGGVVGVLTNLACITLPIRNTKTLFDAHTPLHQRPDVAVLAMRCALMPIYRSHSGIGILLIVPIITSVAIIPPWIRSTEVDLIQPSSTVNKVPGAPRGLEIFGIGLEVNHSPSVLQGAGGEEVTIQPRQDHDVGEG
jgi:hypothetical protein